MLSTSKKKMIMLPSMKNDSSDWSLHKILSIKQANLTTKKCKKQQKNHNKQRYETNKQLNTLVTTTQFSHVRVYHPRPWHPWICVLVECCIQQQVKFSAFLLLVPLLLFSAAGVVSSSKAWYQVFGAFAKISNF